RTYSSFSSRSSSAPATWTSGPRLSPACRAALLPHLGRLLPSLRTVMEVPSDPSKLRRLGRATGAVIVVGAIVAAMWVTHIGYVRPRTDDATVRANVVGIAPQVSGPIALLNVQDNQAVQQNDVLFT